MINNNDDFLKIFEEMLSDFTGAPYVVLTDRCTNAILLALKATGVKKVILPRNTYLSIPMTLINYNIDVGFSSYCWSEEYLIEGSVVFDSAVALKKDMYKYHQNSIQCLSFQQKKRLNIGKGGAILLDDYDLYLKLQRMVHDGRSRGISDRDEISESPDDIILGYHMNMSPDEAAKGILLLNQLPEYKEYSYKNYPDISRLKCFLKK